MKIAKIISIVGVFMASFTLSCHSSDKKTTEENYKVTFIELGSVKCIPCQKIQSVMDSIRSNYGDQVKIIFYDVWTKEGKPYGNQYKIKVIPTQVFLDKDGKEYYRHEGYFPLEAVRKVLGQKGIK